MSSGIDFTSPTWEQVVRWAQSELERARKINDGELDPTRTASVRGEIRFIKRLLDLPEMDARERNADPA